MTIVNTLIVAVVCLVLLFGLIFNVLIVVVVCLVLLFGLIFICGLIANVAIKLWKLCRLLLTSASKGI